MSSSVHVDKKKKILVLGEGPTQALDDTTVTPETKYPVNFIQSEKRLVLSLYYNESNSFLFSNAVKLYQLKAKVSEMKPYHLCLGNVSKDYIIDNTKKTRLKGYVHAFLLIITLLILTIFWIFIKI